MKRGILTYLVVGLALVGLASCSNDHVVPERNVDILSRFNAEGQAWMNLEIDFQLPEATRAANGNFEKGEGDELNVKNGMLLLFHKGSTDGEDNLQLASVYSLSPSFSTSAQSQIEQETSKFAQQIRRTNLTEDDDVYLLVLLNTNTPLSTWEALVGKTFSEVKAITTEALTSTIGGSECFFMSNVPLATEAGGSHTPSASTAVSTLVKVQANRIFPTEDEAKESPAANIVVERAAAKVTVSLASTSKKYILGNDHVTFDSGDMSFVLDNYNTTFHLTRHFSTNWLTYNAGSTGCRMVDENAIYLGYSLYRTYWGEDVNYTGKSGLTEVTDLGAAPWKAFGTSAYCAENTFDVGYMQDDCTTSVLLRLQLNGGDFYTTSVSGRDIILQPGDTPMSEEGSSAQESFAPRRSSRVTPSVTLASYLRQWLMQFADVRTWVDTHAAGNPRFIHFQRNADAAGAVTLTASVLSTELNAAAVSAFPSSDIATHLSNITVYYYPSGYCYYRVPIQHFGQELTPWSAADGMVLTAASAYGGNATAYLGRYGMVRNNWYKVYIDDIAHVGSPTRPSLTDRADDMVEKHVQATVTISDWSTPK